MTEYSGSGDPARTMALLWGAQRPPTRGPKPGLSVERILQVAIAMADAEGLAALSMRRIADRLGVGTMSLYTYVPGKAELLDLMLDSAEGELASADGVEGDWRARLEHHARQDWAMYHRHPWVLEITGTRALLGPHELDVFEARLRALSGVGLSGAEMVDVISLVSGYTSGAARSAVDAASAEQRTGISDDQWWNARAPLLERYLTAERYPTLMSGELDRAWDQPDDDHAGFFLSRALRGFEFGLQRVLDGIAAYIEQRSARR